MNVPQQKTRSQIVEASRRRRIARWRAMCDAAENPLAPDAHPESSRLYRELIEARGGDSQVSPQQLILIQRIVVIARRLGQIHTAIENDGGAEFLPAEASYTWLLQSLLKTLGLFRASSFMSFDEFVARMQTETSECDSTPTPACPDPVLERNSGTSREGENAAGPIDGQEPTPEV